MAHSTHCRPPPPPAAVDMSLSMSYPTSPPGEADTQHNDDDDSLPPTGGSSPSLPVGRTSVGEHS